VAFASLYLCLQSPRSEVLVFNVKLSLKVEYACRVLAQLSRNFGNSKFFPIDELAALEEIPANYLVQILSELRNGGLINSRRGKQGGYSLAKAPSDISLYEIITVIDGELLGINLDANGSSGAGVQKVWKEVVEALKKKTMSYSLESFLPVESDDMYYI
jgi:Rrf2 family transcriptional regulator, cysteine metabolism repressor